MKQQRVNRIVASIFVTALYISLPACGSTTPDRTVITGTPVSASTLKAVATAIVIPTITAIPTATTLPTAIPHQTAVTINEPAPTIQPVTAALTAKALAVCQSARPAQQRITSLPKRTLPEASVLAFWVNTWDKDAQWKSLDIPFVSAIDANGVHYLICILETKTKSGTYKGGSSGATGWKVDWDVTLLEYPSGTPVASAHLQGDDPPYSVTTSKDTKDIYGMPPTDALRAMLLDISAGKHVVADGYPIGAVAFSSDGKTLLTCSFNIGGTTKAWNIETGRNHAA